MLTTKPEDDAAKSQQVAVAVAQLVELLRREKAIEDMHETSLQRDFIRNWCKAMSQKQLATVTLMGRDAESLGSQQVAVP